MKTSFEVKSTAGSAELGDAIRFALATGAGAVAAFSAPQALAADASSSSATLEEVVITGSHIRRVDTETANPVLTIDKAAIEQSGITTLGDLVSRIPSVSGSATNPQVNNGGGTGEATIELRGLDANRPLVLLDGPRLGIVADFDATDVNHIPVSILDGLGGLKEGADAVDGSDAVGGAGTVM